MLVQLSFTVSCPTTRIPDASETSACLFNLDAGFMLFIWESMLSSAGGQRPRRIQSRTTADSSHWHVVAPPPCQLTRVRMCTLLQAELGRAQTGRRSLSFEILIPFASVMERHGWDGSSPPRDVFTFRPPSLNNGRITRAGARRPALVIPEVCPSISSAARANSRNVPFPPAVDRWEGRCPVNYFST